MIVFLPNVNLKAKVKRSHFFSPDCMPENFPSVRIDLFVLIILLGIVQVFFLAYFF
jgi:hypothetical protein